jgi:hypothetical protein
MARNYFAVRHDAVTGQSLFTRFGRSRPRLSKDDSVVLYEKSGRKVDFIGTAAVESVQSEESKGTNIGQEITLTRLQRFPEERPLTCLAGSLQKVYRFMTPERHFQRAIVKLTHADFEAIAQYRIDLHRSIFRYLFSALPIELQADFVRLCVREFRLSPNGEVTQYEHLCPLILSYYTDHVGAPFQLIQAVAREFGRLDGINGVGELDDLYLADGATENRIQLGSVAWRISGLIETNALFATEPAAPNLIQETHSQLEEDQAATRRTEPERQRRWKDRLF